MTNAFVTIHGHFYQPPRESPWLEAIEAEDSARPFHDWNERIASECYRPNASARIVDGQGKILDIVNNYASISFNFGPTLLLWIEAKMPTVYQKILEADRESLKRLGHGNAIGQAYNHVILPLSNERDKETEVSWGISDFERRFGRGPEAIWLPETAVDTATLRVLARHGMKFLILSPFQASKVRPFGAAKWTDVSGGRIDPSQPYRCFIKDASGKKADHRFIDLFFYDGGISKEVGFDGLLKDGNAFCDRFGKALHPSRKRPQLVHIAIDGETFGHHKPFGDMALAYALDRGFSSRGMEAINYGAFLERFPPLYEVEIEEGPNGEGTSWSCCHGVGRWKEDCGCSTGAMAGWNQQWRRPLREALNFLRDDLADLFEREGQEIFNDPWEARNGYIALVVDRSEKARRDFFARHGAARQDESEIIRGLNLLEMQRNCLQMYTSCGWFFADMAGLETVIILQHAARAIQLAQETGAEGIEDEFLLRLSKGRGNLPDAGSGADIYRRFVKPRCVPLDQIAAQHAALSFIGGREERRKIYCYDAETLAEVREGNAAEAFVLGRGRFSSEIVPEPKEFLYASIRSSEDLFRTWVAGSGRGLSFEALSKKGNELQGKNDKARSDLLAAIFGDRVFTIRDIVGDEKAKIFRLLLRDEADQYGKACGELFDRSKELIRIMAGQGIEAPPEIRAAAEKALNQRLIEEIEKLKKDLTGTLNQGGIDRIIEESRKLRIELKRGSERLLLGEILDEKMNSIENAGEGGQAVRRETIKEILSLLESVGRWGLDLPREDAQNRIHRILRTIADTVEKSWWEGSPANPFPADLIPLAEGLGFNVDRFKKLPLPKEESW
jgi:alpha-amylase/alpha-mannosidase (GH57 family)